MTHCDLCDAPATTERPLLYGWDSPAYTLRTGPVCDRCAADCDRVQVACVCSDAPCERPVYGCAAECVACARGSE